MQIVKSPAYSPMLNNVSSSIVGSEVNDDQAKIAVKIVAADGRQLTYVFVLSKQNEGEFNNCWMTDAVAPLKDGEDALGSRRYDLKLTSYPRAAIGAGCPIWPVRRGYTSSRC